ncbi:MAG: ATP-dependent zinc metalloprotease FtsH [Acidimicrobiia bacterium]|nr:ATP-dependent zinc metalloprotease FtsH [Acidimicrobiia bacterium]
MKVSRRFGALLILLVIAIAAVVWWPRSTPPAQLDLTEFNRELAAGQVRTVTLLDRDHALRVGLTDGREIAVRFPDQSTDEITTAIAKAGVSSFKVDPQTDNRIVSALLGLLPLALILGVLLVVLRQAQGGRAGLLGLSGKGKPLKDRPTVTFADVAGCPEAIEELSEIRDFLTAPTRFEMMGARIPKGVLLFGPPGTGKTLLARAVAGEAGVPFFSLSGSDFVEMFVGVGASRVRKLFEQAKAAAPAIIFIDELDAVGRQRGAGVGGGHDEREQTLNQMLVEMDGFDATSGVIVLASTNRPDILDPALLRPGRFDRQIVIDPPDLDGRIAILGVYARRVVLADDVDLEVLARRTAGFTGADLENLINEAALLATRQQLVVVSAVQLEEAIDRVVGGPERRSRILSDAERRVIAYHEGGHALVGHALPGTDPVHRVTIIPRGRSLGSTLSLPTEDRFLVRRSELMAQLAMLLGGRAAEELVFVDPTTGAQDDIARATTIARQMVTEFGMSDALGPMRFGEPEGEVFLGRDISRRRDYSDTVAARIDDEVHALLDQAHQVARELLTQHRGSLDRLVAGLLERETLQADEVDQILSDVKRDDAPQLGGARPTALRTSERPSLGRIV